MEEDPLDRLFAPTIRFEDMRIGDTGKADGFFILVAKPDDSSPNSATVMVSGELVLLNWNIVWKTNVQLYDGTQVPCLQELVEAGGTYRAPLYRPTGCYFIPNRYSYNCISPMEFVVSE